MNLSSYFNIILSIVVLTYSLIIGNAKYSERIHAAEDVLNAVKAKKREIRDDNVEQTRLEYEEIMSNAEYRLEVDFFRTLKQMCKKMMYVGIYIKWIWKKWIIKMKLIN